MSSFQQQLHALAGAVMDGTAAAEPLVDSSATELPAKTRLHIYRDGYLARLQKCVLADYPALAAYVGLAELETHIADYCSRTKSSHWDLNRYSVGFADDVKQWGDKAAQQLAQFEAAIIDLFWQEKQPGEDTSTTTNTQQFALPALHRWQQVDYDLDSYRNGAGELAPLQAPRWLLLYRHEHSIKRMYQTDGQYACLQTIHQQTDLGEALDRLVAARPNLEPELAENLQEWMQQWVAGGVLRPVAF